MDVRKEIVIENKVVNEIAKIAELIFYSPVDSEKDFIYISRNDKVIGTISIGADACQNSGYISHLEIKQC